MPRSLEAYNARWNSLDKEFQLIKGLLSEIVQYIDPTIGRFLTGDHDDAKRYKKKHNKIINGRAGLAVRTTSSGMMSGLTSPSRPWFNLAAPDPDMNKFARVKNFLEETERRMNIIFSRSNLYTALPRIYKEMALVGTGAMAQVEDFETFTRFHPYTIGEYRIGVDKRSRIGTFYRQHKMTIDQAVDIYGKDKLSQAARNLYMSSKGTEERITIRSLVERNDDRIPDMAGFRNMPYRSVHYEVGADNEEKYLKVGGFEEFSIYAPRWAVGHSSDAWGIGLGEEALGDVKGLQIETTRKVQAIDRMSNPPVIGPSGLRQNGGADLLPGGMTFFDEVNSKNQLRAVYQVDPRIMELMEDIREIESRISRFFYEDLFLMLTNIDRRQITAREVEERHEEKLLMLGPVLERLNDELLDPIIDRTFNIMARNDLLPTVPPELEGVQLKVEYVSILHQAQRSVGVGAVDRLVAHIGEVAKIKPQVVDKLNEDEDIDAYAEMLGVRNKVVRPTKEVEAIRQQRAEDAQRQEQAALAAQAVDSAKTLSETEVSGDSALAALTG